MVLDEGSLLCVFNVTCVCSIIPTCGQIYQTFQFYVLYQCPVTLPLNLI